MERRGSYWSSKKEASRDVGMWIHIIKKRKVFAYGAADTFEAGAALTAGRLTALGRCEARHIQKVTLNESFCVCVKGAPFILNSSLCSNLQNRYILYQFSQFLPAHPSASFFLIAAFLSTVFSSFSPKVSPRDRKVFYRPSTFMLLLLYMKTWGVWTVDWFKGLFYYL